MMMTIIIIIIITIITTTTTTTTTITTTTTRTIIINISIFKKSLKRESEQKSLHVLRRLLLHSCSPSQNDQCSTADPPQILYEMCTTVQCSRKSLCCHSL